MLKFVIADNNPTQEVNGGVSTFNITFVLY